MLINPPVSAALLSAMLEVIPQIQHPNQDPGPGNGKGSWLLPPSLPTANVFWTGSTRPMFLVLSKSPDKKHFLPPKGRLRDLQHKPLLNAGLETPKSLTLSL